MPSSSAASVDERDELVVAYRDDPANHDQPRRAVIRGPGSLQLVAEALEQRGREPRVANYEAQVLQTHIVLEGYRLVRALSELVYPAKGRVNAVRLGKILPRELHIRAPAGEFFDLTHHFAQGADEVVKGDALFPIRGHAHLRRPDALELQQLAEPAYVAVRDRGHDKICVFGHLVVPEPEAADYGARQGVHAAEHVVQHGLRSLLLAPAAHEICVGACGTDELLRYEGAAVLHKRNPAASVGDQLPRSLSGQLFKLGQDLVQEQLTFLTSKVSTVNIHRKL